MMIHRHPRIVAALAIGVALTLASLLKAEDDYDHERALGAVERGEALALPE